MYNSIHRQINRKGTKMYEWEKEVSKTAINSNIAKLKEEIKRVSNVTLRGNFKNPEDRQYWVEKLKRMNSKLSSLEQMN